MSAEHFQDKVEHVSGDDGAGDIFHGGDDVAEPPTKVRNYVLFHAGEAF